MCDAKAYLRKIELLDARINNKLSDLHALRTLTTKITATISPVAVSSSGSQDRLGNAVAKIVDLQEEINRDIDAYVDLKKEVASILENIQDADQLNVLYKRYVEYKPWEQIACEMNFTYRNVCYIHGKALQAVDVILKEGVEDGRKKKDDTL